MPDKLEIRATELMQMIAEGGPLCILDVRDPDECEVQMLPGSVNIPLPELAGRMDEVPKDIPVVTCCLSGLRSMRAQKMLRTKGYDNTLNLAGGVIAWSRQVDPEFRY